MKTRAKRTPPPAVAPHVALDTADKATRLARAVRLVAGMEGLADAERAAVLDRLIDEGDEVNR